MIRGTLSPWTPCQGPPALGSLSVWFAEGGAWLSRWNRSAADGPPFSKPVRGIQGTTVPWRGVQGDSAPLALPGGSIGEMDRGYGREAEGEGEVGVHAGVDQNLDRDALDDLHEVAGGVFRRKCGEA
jgi:hypothetical protein